MTASTREQDPTPTDSVAIDAVGDAAFDIREFARTARGRHRDELDLAAIQASEPGPDAIRLLRILRDLERSTMQRMRNLLVTATHKDARVTAFLTTWAFERFWVADALDAVLEAVGAPAEVPHGTRRRRLSERAERRGPVLRALAANFDGHDIVGAHMTTGLVDEWITQAAFRRLGEMAAGLHSVADMVVTIKDRHVRFLAEEAQRLLAASPRASRLARREVDRAVWPVGAIDESADDRGFLERIVFGTTEGAAEARRIAERLAALPGLASVAPTVSARLTP